MANLPDGFAMLKLCESDAGRLSLFLCRFDELVKPACRQAGSSHSAL